MSLLRPGHVQEGCRGGAAPDGGVRGDKAYQGDLERGGQAHHQREMMEGRPRCTPLGFAGTR